MQRRRSCNTKAAPLVSFALSHPFCYLSPSEHDVILRIHHCCACSFLFGWPSCQRSDMTLVEVSQHAYNCLFIRTIVLFVFLRNSCEPDMVLVYFCWINSVWVWVWVWVFTTGPLHYILIIKQGIVSMISFHKSAPWTDTLNITWIFTILLPSIFKK